MALRTRQKNTQLTRQNNQLALADPWALENPLVLFSRHDAWTIGNAVEGTQIFGATGSGKTSGSGATIAKAFLRAGFGGLVLTAKPDDRKDWEGYAEVTGRTNQLVVFSPDNPWRFNFLDYEYRRSGRGGGQTENLVNLFMTAMEVAGRSQGGSGQGGQNEGYFQNAVRQLLRNSIDLLAISRDRITLQDIYRIINTAPQNPQQVMDESWQRNSFCFSCLMEARNKEKNSSRQQDFDLTAAFWTKEFPGLADRTRSSIVSTFTGLADSFLRGTLRDLFCANTTIVPELTHQGAVIVVDLPVKEYLDLGLFAQVIWKYVWQQATERRSVTENPRPVFLWADESQLFVTSNDMKFQSTARGSRAATVYLTQNLPSYYAVLQGQKARDEADSLVGNLQTKIFHANGDPATNEWAANSIGKMIQLRQSISETRGQSENVPGWFSESKDSSTSYTNSSTVGYQEVDDYAVRPREFTLLRKGGNENHKMVDSIIFQGGRVWNATNMTHIETSFDQDGL